MSTDAPPGSGALAAPAAPPLPANTVQTPATERRRLDSSQLFGSGHEVEISHAGSIYRLRRTALDKLILTK